MVSGALLAIFCCTSLQVLGSANGLALQSQKQLALLAWMERQLQRDEGVLRSFIPIASVNCQDSNSLQQKRQQLLIQLQVAGLLPNKDPLLVNEQLQRQVELRGDQLLIGLISGSPQHQRRERLYSLEGLGVCAP
jgi:hypothetical protein